MRLWVSLGARFESGRVWVSLGVSGYACRVWVSLGVSGRACLGARESYLCTSPNDSPTWEPREVAVTPGLLPANGEWTP